MNNLWEKASTILDGGECLLVASEHIFQVTSLMSIAQLVNEIKIHGHLCENAGISANCIQHADEGCNLIFQGIQRRLEEITDTGYRNFRELGKAVEG